MCPCIAGERRETLVWCLQFVPDTFSVMQLFFRQVVSCYPLLQGEKCSIMELHVFGYYHVFHYVFISVLGYYQ